MECGKQIFAYRTQFVTTFYIHEHTKLIMVIVSGVPKRGGGLGFQTPPPPEIPKALQNRAKLNPFVKTVKNC